MSKQDFEQAIEEAELQNWSKYIDAPVAKDVIDQLIADPHFYLSIAEEHKSELIERWFQKCRHAWWVYPPEVPVACCSECRSTDPETYVMKTKEMKNDSNG